MMDLIAEPRGIVRGTTHNLYRVVKRPGKARVKMSIQSVIISSNLFSVLCNLYSSERSEETWM